MTRWRRAGAMRRTWTWRVAIVTCAAGLVSTPGWAATCAEASALLAEGYFVPDVVRLTGMEPMDIFWCQRALELSLVEPGTPTPTSPRAGRTPGRPVGTAPLWIPAPPPDVGVRR